MKFVAPEIEVKYFCTEDVITASQTYQETYTSMSGSADCPVELPMD